MERGANFTLRRDAWGRLVFRRSGSEEVSEVYPVRAFPLSAPQQGLAICDRRGAELIWIDDFASLDAETARLIGEELAEREFTPKISRIVRVHSTTEPSEWEVETDRGPTRFLVRHDEDVRRIDAARALVTDSSGVRYLIEDVRRLDAASRRALERYL